MTEQSGVQALNLPGQDSPIVPILLMSIPLLQGGPLGDYPLANGNLIAPAHALSKQVHEVCLLLHQSHGILTDPKSIIFPC